MLSLTVLLLAGVCNPVSRSWQEVKLFFLVFQGSQGPKQGKGLFECPMKREWHSWNQGGHPLANLCPQCQLSPAHLWSPCCHMYHRRRGHTLHVAGHGHCTPCAASLRAAWLPAVLQGRQRLGFKGPSLSREKQSADPEHQAQAVCISVGARELPGFGTRCSKHGWGRAGWRKSRGGVLCITDWTSGLCLVGGYHRSSPGCSLPTSHSHQALGTCQCLSPGSQISMSQVTFQKMDWQGTGQVLVREQRRQHTQGWW